MAVCSVCDREFEVRFRYQVSASSSGFQHYCSQLCQQSALSGTANALSAGGTPQLSATQSAPLAECTTCGKDFELEYAFQAVTRDERVSKYCTMACRSAGERAYRSAYSENVPRPQPASFAKPSSNVRVTPTSVKTAKNDDRASTAPSFGEHGPRCLAVFNHKGGTGKTTTAVNLAAGLVETGRRVLLVDADSQGNVAASLGIEAEKTLYHVLATGASPESVVVRYRDNFDVLPSNELLAVAELHLATRPNRDRVLRERLASLANRYDVVIIDCAPALSLMNQNALVVADSVVVPVSCDYLSIVGVKQVLRTLKNVRELLKHPVALLGVLPTFFDVRNKIARESVAALTEHFGERCLPPIRVNTKLREAPSVQKTIFDFAPDSHGALDYRVLVDFVSRLRGEVNLESAIQGASGQSHAADSAEQLSVFAQAVVSDSPVLGNPVSGNLAAVAG